MANITSTMNFRRAEVNIWAQFSGTSVNGFGVERFFLDGVRCG